MMVIQDLGEGGTTTETDIDESTMFMNDDS